MHKNKTTSFLLPSPQLYSDICFKEVTFNDMSIYFYHDFKKFLLEFL